MIFDSLERRDNLHRQTRNDAFSGKTFRDSRTRRTEEPCDNFRMLQGVVKTLGKRCDNPRNIVTNEAFFVVFSEKLATMLL
jgi:hypothetical protein